LQIGDFAGCGIFAVDAFIETGFLRSLVLNAANSSPVCGRILFPLIFSIRCTVTSVSFLPTMSFEVRVR